MYQQQAYQKDFDGINIVTEIESLLQMYSLNAGILKHVRIKVKEAVTSDVEFAIFLNDADIGHLTMVAGQRMISKTDFAHAIAVMDDIRVSVVDIGTASLVAPIGFQTEIDETFGAEIPGWVAEQTLVSAIKPSDEVYLQRDGSPNRTNVKALTARSVPVIVPPSGGVVTITGTDTNYGKTSYTSNITSIVGLAEGEKFTYEFTANGGDIVGNGSTFIVQGGTVIGRKAGDKAELVGLAGGAVELVNYIRIGGVLTRGGLGNPDNVDIFAKFDWFCLWLRAAASVYWLVINVAGPFTTTRQLLLQVNDNNRSVDLQGDVIVSGNTTVSGVNTGDQTPESLDVRKNTRPVLLIDDTDSPYALDVSQSESIVCADFSGADVHVILPSTPVVGQTRFDFLVRGPGNTFFLETDDRFTYYDDSLLRTGSTEVISVEYVGETKAGEGRNYWKVTGMQDLTNWSN